MRALLKSDLHDALFVRKYRLVAIAKIEAPDLHVLVRGAGHNKFGVIGNVH